MNTSSDSIPAHATTKAKSANRRMRSQLSMVFVGLIAAWTLYYEYRVSALRSKAHAIRASLREVEIEFGRLSVPNPSRGYVIPSKVDRLEVRWTIYYPANAIDGNGRYVYCNGSPPGLADEKLMDVGGGSGVGGISTHAVQLRKGYRGALHCSIYRDIGSNTGKLGQLSIQSTSALSVTLPDDWKLLDPDDLELVCEWHGTNDDGIYYVQDPREIATPKITLRTISGRTIQLAPLILVNGSFVEQPKETEAIATP